jgi:hypothetical protein
VAYSKKTKAEAVRVAVDRGVSEAAKLLNIKEELLQGWLQKAKSEPAPVPDDFFESPTTGTGTTHAEPNSGAEAEAPEPIAGSSLAGDPHVPSTGPVDSLLVASSNAEVEPFALVESNSTDGGDETNNAPPVDAGSQTWFLATNHLNAAYMLSAGLLMGPAGFGEKYYSDPAGVFRGWLPLFRNGVPSAALDETFRENPRLLRRCIAEVDITQLSGRAVQVTCDGEVQFISLPATIASNVAALLVPAPLPLTLLTRLNFFSEDDRKQFDGIARNDPTIDLSSIQVQVAGQLLPEPPQMTWPPGRDVSVFANEEDDKPPVRGQAIGGVLAMLYHLANRSDLMSAAYRIVANDSTEADESAIKGDAVLRELPRWVDSGAPSMDAPPNARLYWGAVQALIEAHSRKAPYSAVDTTLEFLDIQLKDKRNPEDLRSRLDKLMKAMKATLGMAKGTISDLFRQHPGSLSRPLLLLCLRERCRDLLEFSHPDLKDEELVLAAILFSIREGGWRKLPRELRRPDALARHAMHRMFAIEQSGHMALRVPPTRAKPLRELIASDDAARTELKNDAFLDFAHREGWSDCVVTRVQFPTGKYSLNISDTGIEIEFRGLFENARTEVDNGSLLKRIAQWPPLSPVIEGELRRIFQSGRA